MSPNKWRGLSEKRLEFSDEMPDSSPARLPGRALLGTRGVTSMKAQRPGSSRAKRGAVLGREKLKQRAAAGRRLQAIVKPQDVLLECVGFIFSPNSLQSG